MTGNPVVRWQIISPDPDRTVSFYRKLFSWTSDQSNALGYRELRTGPGGMDGGVWPAPAGTPPMVQLFVAVPDVESHVTRATALGAKVIVPTSVLPDGDTMAVLVDPLGVAFGICTLRPS